MRVLVTGAAGYIGCVLVERLVGAGYEVTATDSLRYGQTIPRGWDGLIITDTRQRKELKKQLAATDAVIPLAALVGAPVCDKYPEEAQEVNSLAVRQLGSILSKDQLIVYPNTNSGYGTTDPSVPCTEDTPLKPISLYARTKAEAEDWLLDHRPSSCIVLRLATVFGPSRRMRTDTLVNQFVYDACRHHKILVRDGAAMRNYVHIQDVADCFVHCIDKADKMVGRAYNLGNDMLNMSKLELAQEVQRLVPETMVEESPEHGSDPDKRNYVVSSKRMEEAGFRAGRPLNSICWGIQAIADFYKTMPDGPWRNV